MALVYYASQDEAFDKKKKNCDEDVDDIAHDVLIRSYIMILLSSGQRFARRLHSRVHKNKYRDDDKVIRLNAPTLLNLTVRQK